MKKTFHYLLAGLTCMSLTFAACSDSSNEPGDPGGGGGGGGQYEETPYSQLTPAQQKEKLGDEANAFINQMKGLNDQKTIEVIDALEVILNNSKELPKVGGTVLETPQDLYKINQFYGNFTWNATTKTWTESPAQELSFNFPVGAQSAQIVVNGVSSGKTLTYEEYVDYYWDAKTGEYVDVYEEYNIQVPKELTAKIMLDGKEEGHIKLNADVVNSSDIPNNASASFKFGDFIFTESAEKNGTAAASLYKGNTELISIKTKLNGKLEDLGESDNYTGNFQLKLMNLVFEGNMDYAKYAKEEQELYARCYPEDYWYIPGFDSDKAWEDYVKGEAEIFNKYVDVYMVSTKDNTKIAKLLSQAKATTRSYTYWGETVTYTDWESVPVLEFGDKTQIEAEVYFTSGFDTVVNNFKDFLKTYGLE